MSLSFSLALDEQQVTEAQCASPTPFALNTQLEELDVSMNDITAAGCGKVHGAFPERALQLVVMQGNAIRLINGE